MRHTIVLFLLSLVSCSCFSQNKNNIYADVSLPPIAYGFSGTWNRVIVNHLDLGAGAQVYAYSADNMTVHTALYLDARPYISWKHSLLFLIGDLGIDLYSEPATTYYYAHANALYTALGLGYGYKINKRGMAPYISLKLAGDNYIAHNTPYTSPSGNTYTDNNKIYSFDGAAVLSVGFKF